MRKVSMVGLACSAIILAGAFASRSGQTETEHPTENPKRVLRIRIGGQVMLAKLTHKVQPKYPKEANKKRIEGTVRMEATIDTDGRIVDLKVLRGDSLLRSAATEAVKEWRYKPTLLNGQPVHVVTEIDVNFELN